MSFLDTLATRRLVLVTGKGGVGKTALAAALGRTLAGRGRRVLLLEVDPRESAHQMLGAPPSGGEILAVGGGLCLQNLRPRRVLDELVRERVRLAAIAARVLRSPVYQHFADGAPGLKELAVLGYSLLLVRGRVKNTPAVETVVLDAPATGHGASLLEGPGLVSEVIHGGPFGRMAAELAGFIGDPALCSVVVVTQAEEMPVTEALELRTLLARRLAREPELLVVNGLFPPLPPDQPARPAGTAWAASTSTHAGEPRPGQAEREGRDAALSLWRARRRLNERELARLAEGWRGPRVELPLLPLARGPRLTAALEVRLRGAAGGES